MAKLFLVPVIFTIKAIPPRCRDSREMHVYTNVELPILEVSKNDAPLATQWTTSQGEQFQTRWYDNNHWSPFKIYDHEKDKTRDTPASAEEIQTLIIEGGYTPLTRSHRGFSHSLKSNTIPNWDPDKFRSVTLNTYEEELKEIQDSFSNSLIIDGELWIKKSEPIYVVKRIRDYTIKASFIEDTDARATRIFNALELDIAAGKVLEHSGNDIEPDRIELIEVIIPESIKYNSEIAAYIEGVSKYIDSLSNRLSEKKTDLIRSWCDLKDSIENYLNNSSNENLANIERNVISTIGNDQSHSFYIDRLQETQKRWEERPIRINQSDDITSLSF